MIFNSKRLFAYHDWFICILIGILSFVGLVFIFSATYRPEQPFSLFFKKQCLGFLTGIIIYWLVAYIDYRVLMRWGHALYFVVIGLLIFTIVRGSIGMGAQRWINLGVFKLQPSELAKLFFPAYAAYSLYNNDKNAPPTFGNYCTILFLLIVSVLLIIKQPDLGTGLIILFSGLTMLWLSGVPTKFFMYGLLVITLTAPLSWKLLKDYQKKRVLVFLGHGESNNERYQIEQSKIAIGSGGFAGKGFLRGTQNQLNFLPESRTDFIFSIIAEEWGFLGACAVIVLYLLLFIRLLFMISYLNDPCTILLALGLMLPIMFSTFINIAMVTNMLPIVGIPLPLISYGVSSLWTTLATFGWLASITMQRFSTR